MVVYQWQQKQTAEGNKCFFYIFPWTKQFWISMSTIFEVQDMMESDVVVLFDGNLSVKEALRKM